jgi:hypothetical protein
MGRIYIRDLNPTFVIFTSTQNWTVPAGVSKIKVLAIGGGGGGGGGYSATYVGGGGGSGSVGYAEVIVQPGTQLSVFVGAGGSAGKGGSSPTGGGNGGASQLQYQAIVAGLGGNGGGAASSTANGSVGGGGGTFPVNVGTYGQVLVYAVSTYMLSGNAGSGQNGGQTPEFAPEFGGASNVSGGFPGGTTSTSNVAFGQGGNGGGVNANGTPGIQGAVIIWWGD